MDHEQINRFALIDRYLMGKLPAEERARFEEHFVDCPQCIAQLHTTKNFISDLRLVAAEQIAAAEQVVTAEQIVAAESASPIAHHQPNRSLGFYLQSILRRPLALAFGCLLIAMVIGTVCMIVYTRQLRSEVNQANNRYEQLERRYEDERESAIATDRMHQETELQQSKQMQTLAAKLKDEEAQRTKMTAELNRQMRPAGNMPIFPLISVRGQERGGSETVNKIPLSGSSTMFAYSIQLVEEKQYDHYRITIFDDHKRRLWQSRRLIPDANSALSTPFDSNFFRPGYYSLIVEGVNKVGGRDKVGVYPFLITKTP
jgi:hypothetical protein